MFCASLLIRINKYSALFCRTGFYLTHFVKWYLLYVILILFSANNLPFCCVNAESEFSFLCMVSHFFCSHITSGDFVLLTTYVSKCLTLCNLTFVHYNNMQLPSKTLLSEFSAFCQTSVCFIWILTTVLLV